MPSVPSCILSLDQFIAVALDGSMPGWATSQRGDPIFARRLRGLDQESQLSQEAVNFHAPFAASVIYHRKSRGKEKEREREIADSPNQGYDVESV